MLRHCLILRKVVLPEHPPGWPCPLDFSLGLKELVLLEGVVWEEAPCFWRVAATLSAPREGEVLLWGKRKDDLPRPELFRLRRRLGYLTPRQALLQNLTLGENIALAWSYFSGHSTSQVLESQKKLLHALDLTRFVREFPARLPPEIYWRGIWARELAKEPELLLACLDGPVYQKEERPLLEDTLRWWLRQHECAVLLAGPDLSGYYPLAHRVLVPSAEGFLAQQLKPERPAGPVDFFPLV